MKRLQAQEVGCWLLALCLLGGGAGCAQTKVTSWKDPVCTEFLRNLVVVVRFAPGASEQYSARLTQELATELMERTARVRVIPVSGLAPEPANLDSLIASSEPEAILVLEHTDVFATANVSVGSIFGAQLLGAGSERILWRASLQTMATDAYGANPVTLAKSAVEALVKRLEKDGIVPET